MLDRLTRLAFLTTCTLVFTCWVSDEDPKIFLVGDSTMADKPLIGNPERGWGQMFPQFFKDAIRIENSARNGRSTKSFIREGRWDAVYRELKPGDCVLIQFGHNDSKKDDSTRYAEPHTDYKANLLRFIRDARSKNATPILITPVCRRRYDAQGKFFDVHGDYPLVVREVGAEENVPVVDLNKKSFELFEKLGAEQTKKRFLWADSGLYSSLPNGRRDDTHFVPLGAIEVAKLVVDEMRRLDIPVTPNLKSDHDVSFEGIGKIVLLDNFYNNEWKRDSAGRQIPYHYLWHDSENSGYAMLGAIIAKTGAVIDTLRQQPTVDNLQRASIYMIVDPDTPTETENPNFITQNAANAITEWVNAGGVLMLFGNDKGNAEFEHLNMLAERFGIHFNEVSRNLVSGKAYQVGTFEHFPEQPIFKDVRKIFIKELSTLKIQEPATAVLTDGGDVIVAFAQVGKGAVFAVGDPWFYNEYMDERKLPAGYDNPKAAENLFRWLLQQAKPHS